MRQKQFEINLNLKELESNDDVIRLEGWANRFVDDTGQVFVDRDNEAVVPFGVNIEEYKSNPVVLYQHRRDEAIGKCTNIEVSEKGIFVACEIYKELHPVAFAAVKRGVLKSFSIGFQVADAVYDEIRDVWLLLKSTLLEISLVSIPANRLSTFSIVKADDGKNYLSYVQDNAEDKLDTILKEIQILKTQITEIVKEVDKSSEVINTESKEIEENLVKNNNISEEKLEEAVEVQGTEEVTTTEFTQDKVENNTLTLEDQLNSILEQVSVDNFEVAYAFYEKLQERLNDTLNSALAQS